MRRSLAILAFACLSTMLFVAHYSAQDSSEQRSLKETVIDGIELTGATSAVSLDEVKSMSEVGVVATITEGGCAYAVGFAGDLAFKTRVWEGVSQSFGVYAGRLAFSKPMPGAVGEGLFIVDLGTNEQQSLFPEHSILRAEWQPMGRSLAAVVRRGSDDSLLLYGLGDGKVETLRQQFVQPSFLRWSEDGDILYFVEGYDSQEQRYLVQRSLSISGEARTGVEGSEIQFLSAASDSKLQSYALKVTDDSYLDERIAIQRNSDGSADLKLQSAEQETRVVKNAVPIRRVQGGLLLEFSDSNGAHLSLWHFGSGTLHVFDSPDQSVSAAVANGFDYPVGKPDGIGWLNNHNGLGFLEQYNYGGTCGWTYHPGNDFNKDGTTGDGDRYEPVYAAANGTVIDSAYYGTSTWGNVILIEHVLPDGSKVWSQYGHLENRLVQTGATVGKGDQIGRVGKGDGTLSAHLHFEVRKVLLAASAFPCGQSAQYVQDRYYDPIAYLNSHRVLSPYEGYHDGVDCSNIYGWAWNSTLPNSTVNVNIYYDGNNLLAANVPANQFRSDLPGGGLHAFNYPTPAFLKNGQSHSIRVQISANNQDLIDTPRSFTCGCTGGTKAVMQSPANGSTFSGPSVTFTWNSGSNVTQYWLYLGNSPGANDIYSANQGTSLSANVNSIPTDGRNIYVTLWSYICGAWQSNPYSYHAFTVCSGTKAVMQSPANGSTFSSSSVAFTWSSGSNVTQYWLYLGNSPGAQDIYSANQGTNLSANVNSIPTDGRNIYVTLWSNICGAWQSNPYSYHAFTGCSGGTKAVMQSPANGSTFSSSFVTFTWNSGSNVAGYWLYVGNSPGAQDIYTAGQGTNLSANVSNIPTDGRNIYVTLWSYICGAWQSNPYSYHAFTGCSGGTKAVMQSPANGSTFSSSSVTFTWSSGSNVAGYWLYVGNSPGAQDIYTAGQGTNLSANVSNIPTDGRNIYVTLWSYICGAWQSNPYSYHAFTGCSGGTKAVMLSPPNGSNLTSATVTFTWSSGSNVSQYWLYFGNSPGAQDLYTASQGTNTSVTLTGFPRDGRTIYVTLWSYVCGSWQSNSYFYFSF